MEFIIDYLFEILFVIVVTVVSSYLLYTNYKEKILSLIEVSKTVDFCINLCTLTAVAASVVYLPVLAHYLKVSNFYGVPFLINNHILQLDSLSLISHISKHICENGLSMHHFNSLFVNFESSIVIDTVYTKLLFLDKSFGPRIKFTPEELKNFMFIYNHSVTHASDMVFFGTAFYLLIIGGVLFTISVLKA